MSRPGGTLLAYQYRLGAMSRTLTTRLGPSVSPQVTLPDGVTAAEWALEKVRHQNPRIRTYLGCLRLFDDLVESDYAILHCSPSRLLEMWRRVRSFSDVLRTELAPTLRPASQIPALDEARRSAEAALISLDNTVLAELDRAPEELSPDRLTEVRELLCVSIGQINAFLQDTFGKIIASDPRSLHDADYYLSRRFPREIDEAEWLYETVGKLHNYLQSLDEVRPQSLTKSASKMLNSGLIPDEETWMEVSSFLLELLNNLTTKLKEILCLRGIRFEEMRILNRYAIEIPTQCLKLFEIRDLARETLRAIEDGEPESAAAQEHALKSCQIIFSRRMAKLISDLDKCLNDIVVFVPLWHHNIERRRALVLKKSAGRSQDEQS